MGAETRHDLSVRSKKGFFTTRAVARLRRCSTVIPFERRARRDHGARSVRERHVLLQQRDQPPLVA